ncbi:hypothetical protein JL722_1873 [Aureococcus anophagefferens]|nr:hypothetical protein JL722_1873 [Aureococcus anophagefferens]
METRFDVGIVSLGTNDAKESLWGAIEDDWVATYVDLIEELRSASPGAYFTSARRRLHLLQRQDLPGDLRLLRPDGARPRAPSPTPTAGPTRSLGGAGVADGPAGASADDAPDAAVPDAAALRGPDAGADARRAATATPSLLAGRDGDGRGRRDGRDVAATTTAAVAARTPRASTSSSSASSSAPSPSAGAALWHARRRSKRPVGAAPPPPPKSGWAVPEAESPGADACDVDIDSPGDPPAPSPFLNIERALFPDDEEVKEDPYRPLVHGASDIDFDEHGDAVEFGRVSDESAAGYEV